MSPSALTAVAGRYGGAPRSSLAEVLADAPDGLLLLTPGSHGADALAAAEAGIPILCEKPLAYSLAEADALAAAAVALQLGYMKLYDPAVERAVAATEGRPVPRSIEVTVLHPPTAPQLAHARVAASAGDVPLDTRERLEAQTTATLERALGEAPVELRRHYLEHATGYREEVRVHDDLGTVELVFPSPYLLHAPTVFSETGSGSEGEETRGFRSTAEAFERQLEAFHRFVTEGERPRAGVAEGRTDIATCQRIARRLAEEHGWAIGGEAAQ